jgi:hypothetical protein
VNHSELDDLNAVSDAPKRQQGAGKTMGSWVPRKGNKEKHEHHSLPSKMKRATGTGRAARKSARARVTIVCAGKKMEGGRE